MVLGPRIGVVFSGFTGIIVGGVAAVLVVGWEPSRMLQAGVLTAVLAIGANCVLVPWGTVMSALGFIQEVVVCAEMLTLFSLRLALTITVVALRGSYHVLQLFDHTSLVALWPSLYSSCTKILLNAETLCGMHQIAQMVCDFVSEIWGVLSLPALTDAMRAIHLAQRGAQPAGEKVAMSSCPRALGADRLVRYACACYGHVPLKFLGLLPMGCAPTDDAAFALLSGCHDIVLSKWGNALFAPGYVLAFDHAHRTLVLSIRGSLFPVDVMTDLLCEAVPCELLGIKGTAHNGMFRAATALSGELLPIVTNLIAQRKYAAYSLLLVGHSLGAGVVAILAAMWLSSTLVAAEPDRLRAVGFGTPACLSRAISAALVPYMTTWVIGTDMVPRFSLASARRLRDAALARWKVRHDTVQLDALAATVYSPHDLDLCTAGYVLWLAAEHGLSLGVAAECTVVARPDVAFCDLLLSPDMFSIHVPQSYYLRLGGSGLRLG